MDLGMEIRVLEFCQSQMLRTSLRPLAGAKRCARGDVDLKLKGTAPSPQVPHNLARGAQTAALNNNPI